MSFLKEYGFLDVDIEEFLENTPKKVIDVLESHENLVRVNLSYLKDLGITTYKEIFINYPDMFLMDASNFEESFSKYDKEELVLSLIHISEPTRRS